MLSQRSCPCAIDRSNTGRKGGFELLRQWPAQSERGDQSLPCVSWCFVPQTTEWGDEIPRFHYALISSVVLNSPITKSSCFITNTCFLAITTSACRYSLVRRLRMGPCGKQHQILGSHKRLDYNFPTISDVVSLSFTIKEPLWPFLAHYLDEYRRLAWSGEPNW